MNEERTFGSKQAYLTIQTPDTHQLRETNSGTWSIEDTDGFKICDGELMRSMSDQMLLDYIPRDKTVSHLKYELVLCSSGDDDNEKCSMISGQIEPVSQTDSTIEFVIQVDS